VLLWNRIHLTFDVRTALQSILTLQRLVVAAFFPVPPHVHIDLMVPLPGCGNKAQLCCPDDVIGMYERGVPGGALNLNSTSYPDQGRYGSLPLQGKIATA
jgi:hypothetical protein